MPTDLALYSALLNLLIFLPLAGIPFLWIAGKGNAKYIAFISTVATLVLGLVVYGGYLMFSAPQTATEGFVFGSSLPWLDARYDIKFMTGVDGISVYLMLLGAILFPLVVLFSMGTVKEGQPRYYTLLLMLQTGCLGVFLATDLVVFFMFFELGLIPMFFLIGIWGGVDRTYAASKFFVYTLAGSLLMMLGIAYLGFEAGPQVGKIYTSDYKLILQAVELDSGVQFWLFWAFALAFAIKVPVFPFHTWQPIAYSQAPAGATVVLAGIMGKMGAFGFIRFCLPLFPMAAKEYAMLFGVLGLVAILYGGLVAMVQTNLKKLVAYSSLAHMGFVLVGIFSMNEEALSGAVLQMFNHGITIGALFLLLGMLEARAGSMEVFNFRGLAKTMPTFTFLFILATFASIGVPGFNGFVGEFLILMGAFQSPVMATWLVVAGAAGVIIAAVYMLWMFRRVFFGAQDDESLALIPDVGAREVFVVLPLLLLMVFIGFQATPFLAEIGRSTGPLVLGVQRAIENALVSLP